MEISCSRYLFHDVTFSESQFRLRSYNLFLYNRASPPEKTAKNREKQNASLVRGVSVAGLSLSLREEEGGGDEDVLPHLLHAAEVAAVAAVKDLYRIDYRRV